MSVLVTLDDYEAAARTRVSVPTWEYIHSGAGDEHSLRWNREAFSRLSLDPRVLKDVSRIDTRVNLFGQELAHPILLAPVAMHGLVHPDGEVATARGARAADAGMVLSSYTSRPVEEVSAEGPSPLWFQLYLQEKTATRNLIQHVARMGCSAICVTVDTPTLGARDRTIRSGFVFPTGLPYRVVPPGENPVTWDDVKWIRKAVKVPVLLKGITHPRDAELAIKAGVAGIIVSNHGGRNLDTIPATIDLLPRIVSQVRGRVPVLMDGGIRRGTDVLKALALGADAVLIGRPAIYGLSVSGAAGVKSVIEILRKELMLAMALVGRTNVGDLDESILFRQTKTPRKR